MRVRDFDSIPNEWNINNEGDRWNMKVQFPHKHTFYYCLDDFVDVPEQRHGPPRYDVGQIIITNKVFQFPIPQENN